MPPTTTVLGVGDSVMLGASSALRQAIPGMVIDAVVSRQFWQAVPVLQQYLPVLPANAAIVIHLGTNGAFNDGHIDELVRLLGNRSIYFVTARVPTRGWQDGNNDRIRAAPTRWPNVKVIEWFAYSNPHPEWFEPDMFHVNAVGAQNYAAFVKQAVFGG